MTTATSGVSTPLPPQANLEHLKKQAKQLLHAFRDGDAEALQTIKTFHPKPESFASLRDAQLVIARRYGCQDWEQLTQAVELQKLRAATLQDQALQFITLACLRYNGDDRAYRHAQATTLLAEVPELPRVNLYCALVAGSFAAVKQHLDKDPKLATRNGGPFDWPPLMYLTYSRVRSTKQEVLDILQLLLTLGASPNSHVMLDGLYRFTALAGAMGEGERGPVDCPPHPFAEPLVDALLAAGAVPNEFQGLYNTMFTDGLDRWLPKLIAHGLSATDRTDPANPASETTFDFLLCFAAPRGRIKRLGLLLENGANPNAVSRYDGRSAHTSAVLAEQRDCAAVLLQYGAKAETLGIADEFRIACWRNDLERADALLQANPALKDDPQVFADVARAGGLLVPWLIERGFAIDMQTSDGRTVLHRIAAGDELDVVKAMIALGADPNLTEHHYRGTPLGFAIHNRAWNVVHYLKDLATDIFDVCRLAHVPRVAELLARDSTLATQRTPMGNTPLHLVSEPLQEEDIDSAATTAVIRLLLQNGADPHALNNEGLTAVQWQRKMGKDEVADLLVRETVT